MSLGHDTSGEGAPVSFIHGFTQTRSSWQSVISCLTGWACTTIDAPGHGQSTDGARTLWQCADDIADVMPRGILVGYSMGARMALHTALAHTDTVTGLVLVSGTPGIENENDRRARRTSDDALAARIEERGVPAFIDEWLGNPMFAGLTAESAMREQRLGNSAVGLADSLRFAGTGTQENLWPRLTGLQMPVLIVTGERDAKFTEIGVRMQAAIGGSELRVVASAGHTVHLEANDEFCQLLRDWLVRRRPERGPRRT